MRIKLIVNMVNHNLNYVVFQKSEKRVSYHVNDLFNFEATDRLFPQRSNFYIQKQTKDVICL